MPGTCSTWAWCGWNRRSTRASRWRRSTSLRERIALSGDVTVAGVQREQGLLRVTLFRTGNPAEGRITLVFADNPMELRQWLVVDGQSRTTRVTLSAIETGIRLDRAVFDFNDPRFMASPVDNN